MSRSSPFSHLKVLSEPIVFQDQVSEVMHDILLAPTRSDLWRSSRVERKRASKTYRDKIRHVAQTKRRHTQTHIDIIEKHKQMYTKRHPSEEKPKDRKQIHKTHKCDRQQKHTTTTIMTAIVTKTTRKTTATSAATTTAMMTTTTPPNHHQKPCKRFDSHLYLSYM